MPTGSTEEGSDHEFSNSTQNGVPFEDAELDEEIKKAEEEQAKMKKDASSAEEKLDPEDRKQTEADADAAANAAFASFFFGSSEEQQKKRRSTKQESFNNLFTSGRESRRDGQSERAKEAKQERERKWRASSSRFHEPTTKAPGGEDGNQKSKARKVNSAQHTADETPAYASAAGPSKFDDEVDPDL